MPTVIAVVAAILTSLGVMWGVFAKWLPGVFDRREAIWEQKQQSQLDDAKDARQEDIDQREANKRFQESQIKVSEAQLVFITQLMETISLNAATSAGTLKELTVIGQSNRATEKALTANTDELSLNTETVNELNKNFSTLLNEGSEPLQYIKTAVDDLKVSGIKPDEEARKQMTRIETAVNEINDKVLPCVEAKTTMDSEMVAVLNEARMLIELFNRDAQLKIEDKRKSDSKPIPTIAADEQTGAAA